MMNVPTIDGFEFCSLLMSSSRCSLWRAVQSALEREVLMVVFSEEVIADEILRETLRGALQVLARSGNGSCVPEILDMAWGEDGAYVMMEDCQAKNIVELLTTSRLDAEQLFQIAEGLTESFTQLHEAHLVYGALRPKSLYLAEDSSPVLPDISMLSFESGYGAALPEESIVGSVSYIAPEVYLDAGHVDTRADMFSMGMTLYALGTGQVPYGALKAEDVLVAKQTMSIPSPCDISPNFPPALASILVKLAQRDPALRYASWDEVRLDLYHARQGVMPSVASPEGSIIAQPNPLARAKAGRTIRLSVNDLKAYRRRAPKRIDRSQVLIGILAVMTCAVVVLLGIVIWMLMH